MSEMTTVKASPVTCCPPTDSDAACDILDFHYRLHYPTTVTINDRRQTVSVEVKLHFRLTRCPGPLAIGDLVYTNTLLPGEKVRLFTSDRRTQFTFDSASNLSYRNVQSSEDSFYLQAFSNSVFDTNSRDELTSSNKSHSHVDGHADAGVDLFSLGGSASMSGNFDSESVSKFLGEHSAHAEASHHSAEQGTRKASSVSVGEVASRTHTQGSSQDHFESASREFANPNKCRAITFMFYQINKTQTIKYTLESIERRVIIDPANDFTRVSAAPLEPSTGVKVTSGGVFATDDKRRPTYLEATTHIPDAATGLTGVRLATFAVPAVEIPTLAARQAALQQVEAELVDAKLIDKKTGKVSDEAKKSFSFEKHSSLPTPGLLVKGCLDDCDICEPSLSDEIQIELEHKRLQNEMLKKQIDLLDKAQEYRCCPDETEPTA